MRTDPWASKSPPAGTARPRPPLTDFETSNGPDVHVYLVAADDALDSAAVTRAGFVEVGPLKGNIGDQNYELPASVDLGRYRAVTIWCKRFSVNFATAPLMSTTGAMSSAKAPRGRGLTRGAPADFQLTRRLGTWP